MATARSKSLREAISIVGASVMMEPARPSSSLATGGFMLTEGLSATGAALTFPPVAHPARTDSAIAITANPAHVRVCNLRDILIGMPCTAYLLVASPVLNGGGPVRSPLAGPMVSGSATDPGSLAWAGAWVSDFLVFATSESAGAGLSIA